MPPGFVVTVHAYRRYYEASGLAARVTARIGWLELDDPTAYVTDITTPAERGRGMAWREDSRRPRSRCHWQERSRGGTCACSWHWEPWDSPGWRASNGV